MRSDSQVKTFFWLFFVINFLVLHTVVNSQLFNKLSKPKGRDNTPENDIYFTLFFKALLYNKKVAISASVARS